MNFKQTNRVLSGLCAVSLGLTSTTLAAEKPNIIFIFADDMGVGDVSHHNGKAPATHLDRMA